MSEFRISVRDVSGLKHKSFTSGIAECQFLKERDELLYCFCDDPKNRETTRDSMPCWAGGEGGEQFRKRDHLIAETHDDGEQLRQ